MCRLVDDVTHTVISCGTRELCKDLVQTCNLACVDVKAQIFDDKPNGLSEQKSNVKLFIKFATRIAILVLPNLQNRQILVYCKSGRSRSTCVHVIAAFFIVFRGFSVEKVVSSIYIDIYIIQDNHIPCALLRNHWFIKTSPTTNSSAGRLNMRAFMNCATNGKDT